MSDRMIVMPFAVQMERILKEYRRDGTVLGIDPLVVKAEPISLFNEKIETPFGPAAGPHTQMAGNIIAAYCAGARFFELKTVQKMDGEELARCVPRPCILAEDECYNVEWSTELTVGDAMDEYIRGWWALKLLSKELGLGAPDGFIFNMSVGYDLEGIKLPKIDNYINSMGDAAETPVWKECKDWALANLDYFKNVDKAYVESISPRVSKSITISTLHGCPPSEIERIAVHLIDVKGLNTFIKCNPTLLGFDFARSTLDRLGFDYISFDDHHYKGDLQWGDAVPMFKRLIKLAADKGVAFGLKLTNTKPVNITDNFLPGTEAYMAGRSLFPLTINLAARVSREFEGKLPISYAGGADFFNVDQIFGVGIFPITMATTLLKPGGYQRITQLVGKIQGVSLPKTIDVAKLNALADSVFTNSRYQKPVKFTHEKKIASKPPLFDCFAAPCRTGCPIEQDVPAYLKAIAEGNKIKAAEIIIERNPLPNITGTICPHTCMDSCNRKQYEYAVDIRGCKLDAAQEGLADAVKHLKPEAKCGKKAAVVGGGPAGLSAAYFLAKKGWDVSLYEKSAKFGGIVRNVIPSFRISDAAIDNDVALAAAMGVVFYPHTEITDLSKLKAENDAVILALGATKGMPLGLKEGESLNAIEFMADLKAGRKVELGSDVVVIGAGNTAMDAARAAKRVAGTKNVSIVYRRDVRNMPADLEELEMAKEDGVLFRELLSPVTFKDGALECEVMKLGEKDSGGRRKPEPTGEFVKIPCTTVIASLGEKVDADFYKKLGVEVNDKGLPINKGNVYAVGDGATGPKTVVQAIASAASAVEKIAGAKFEKFAPLNKEYVGLSKRAVLQPVFKGEESSRCLECSGVCGLCVETCPNRANAFVEMDGKKQVIHIDTLCNECGNCAVFCPYDGRPFRDKFTIFTDRQAFGESENFGYAALGDGKYLVRYEGFSDETSLEALKDEKIRNLIKACEA